MSNMPWIKSYTKKLDDIRLARTSEIGQLAYLKMELLAGKCDADGAFVMNGEQLTEDEIAFYIRMEPKQIKKVMKELVANKLIHLNGRGPQITDFSLEQVSQDVRREAWRARQERHRSVTGDKEDVTGDSDVTHAPRTRTRVKNQNQKKNQKRKDLPTPTPSSRKASSSGRQAGTQSKTDSDSVDVSKIKLNKKQTRHAATAEKILRSCGLRNPKLKTTSNYLAIRNFKTNEELVRVTLAALASTYSDDSVKSPEVVAAWRIEHNEIPQRFENPKTWTAIPAKALTAAGIDDLDRYVNEHNRSKYTSGKFSDLIEH